MMMDEANSPHHRAEIIMIILHPVLYCRCRLGLREDNKTACAGVVR